MKSTRNIFAILAFAVLFTACATPQRHALTLDARNEITAASVLLNTAQNKLQSKHNHYLNSERADPYLEMDSGAIVRSHGVYHPYHANLAVNFVSTLIIEAAESKIESNAQEALKFINKNLDDANYDYMRDFNSQIERSLSTLPWLNVKKLKVKINVRDSESDIVSIADENTTLFIGSTYAISSSFKQLEVVAYVKLIKKAEKGQKQKTLYENNFYFIDRLPKEFNETAIRKSEWQKNNSIRVHSSLQVATKLISELIAEDMSKPNKVTQEANKKTIKLRTINGSYYNAYVIGHKDGYMISSLTNTRESNGYIYAVNNETLS